MFHNWSCRMCNTSSCHGSFWRHNRRLLGEEVESKERWSLNILLCTELLKTSECRSTLDIDVGGAEFSGSDILQQNLKGLGFNLLCVVPRSNGLVVPDFGCRKQLSEAELEMRSEESSS